MKRIILLPVDVSDKIAAGEVIERPASIIKELLENSLDADSNDIAIEISKGGKESIKITDNGIGIPAEDIELAFIRHATSKVYTLEDFYRVRSFGFRGEALPSIAAIARVELLSRPKGQQSGTRIVVENGKIIEFSETGCPEGTSVLVTNIFSTVPARKKFLKSDTAEQGHCIEAITRIAIAQPDLRIRVSANGKSVLAVPRTGELTERAALVLGKDFSRNSLTLAAESNGIKINGLLSSPDFTRSNSRGILFYVNSRFIRDGLLHSAIMSAYRKLIVTGRFPCALIFIEIAPEEIDINVHPAKTEVRFRASNEVYETLRRYSMDALSKILPESTGSDSLYRLYMQPEDKAFRAMERPEPFHLPFSALTPRRGPRWSGLNELRASMQEAERERRDSQETKAEGPSSGYFSSLEYIGQFAGTYLIFSESDAAVIIDQHAAHERIIFERLRGAYRERNMPAQGLLEAEIIELSPAEIKAITMATQYLRSTGFEIEPFGKESIAVRSVPALNGVAQSGPEIRALVSDLADLVQETGRIPGTPDWLDDLFAFMACRSAVKAHHLFSRPEAVELCHDLDTISFASNCPHGRPLFIRISLAELERLFGRK